MKQKTVYLLTIFFFAFISTEAVFAQKKKKKSKKSENSTAVKKKESDYEKITKGAQKDEGLFNVYQKNNKYYYQIPLHLLEKDLLLVSRIAQIPAELGGGYLNAGSKTNEQVIRWEKFNDRVLLKSISFNAFANDSLPIYKSVVANNFNPLIQSFDIEAFSPDSSSVFIDVTPLYTSDVMAITGLSSRLRQVYKVRSLDKSRSYIEKIASFPENIEVKHNMTYSASQPPSNSRTGTISLQMNQSMYLLPEKPMMPRLHDKRVGWFTLGKIDYGSEELKADEKTYIRKWRLEPKDPEAYARGELVEPIKPIVYYLDPATPDKWRPYFKQGIEDWQTAFEAAGFKNAIIAKDAPTKEEDPEWSPEDARYSTVRYVATTTRNAMGPSVTDPRSGEIIESDIVWYHNHLRSYRNRYMLETGAANPKARTLDTPEEEIGEMMRMVISHEIGHALGLPHNMKASYAYPTDSLRSATFTQKWGLASTLMDYTRYNYVAQPGDEGVRWVRMLGPYDNYVINWGYRYIPTAKSPEDEKPTLNQWIKEKEGDPVYLFGGYSSSDPSSQTECVGDDPVKASAYGLSNLKIVAENLYQWTTRDGQNFEDLEELYGELFGVWSRYSGHVIGNIGGIYELRKTADQGGTSYTHLSKEEQKSSLQFINDNVLSTPEWLLQPEIINNIENQEIVERVRQFHSRQIRNLLSTSRLERVVNNEAINGNKAYSISEMMTDLRNGVWSEVRSGRNIDAFRRNVQREHVERLISLLGDDNETSDLSAVARGEMKAIQQICRTALSRYRSGTNRYHLEDISGRIESALNPG